MTAEFQFDFQRLLREWRERLSRLRRFLSRRRPRDWVWAARAKVLAYLLSRYREGASDWPDDSERTEWASSAQAPARPMAAVPPVLPAATAGRTPKSRLRMRVLLEDIHRLNSYNNAHTH